MQDGLNAQNSLAAHATSPNLGEKALDNNLDNMCQGERSEGHLIGAEGQVYITPASQNASCSSE
jgi:hypothetical protein